MSPAPHALARRAALLLALAALARAGEARAQEWIELLGGPVYQLQPLHDATTLAIPVAIADGVRADQVSVRLLAVLRDNSFRPAVHAAFRWPAPPCIRVSPPGPDRGASLLVPINLGATAGQGTYTLLLQARAPGHSPANLELLLAYPAARLREVQPVTVERVWPWSVWSRPKRDTLRVPLEDTAGVMLSPLRARLHDFPPRVRAGRHVQVAPDSVVVPAGDTASLRLTLRGTFPLGTTSGIVEIRAPQLAEPVTVPLEVTQRRTLWLIPIVIAIGVLLGWFVRTGLQQQIQRDEARLRAIDLLDRIAADRSRRLDATFRARAGDAASTLQNKLAARDAEALTTEVEAADAEWRAALEDLETRRVAAQIEVDAYAALVRTPWSLPESFAPPQQTLRESVDRAAKALIRFDAGTADRELPRARDTFVQEMAAPLADWRHGLDSDLDSLVAAELPLPAAVAERLQMAAGELRTLLAGVVRIPLDASPAEVAPILQTVHDVRVNLRELGLQLRIWLRSAVRDLVVALRRMEAADAAALEQLHEKLDAADAALSRASVPPEALPPLLLGEDETLPALDAAMRALVERAAEALEVADRETIEEPLDARRYPEAARALAEALRAQRAAVRDDEEGELLGDEETTARRLAETTTRLPGTPEWAAHSDLRSAPLVTRVLAAQAPPPPLALIRARTFKELLVARRLRTALIGLLILLSGFALFAPNFVGTFEDLAQVFFWAFALDVTLDTLLSLVPAART